MTLNILYMDTFGDVNPVQSKWFNGKNEFPWHLRDHQGSCEDWNQKPQLHSPGNNRFTSLILHNPTV